MLRAWPIPVQHLIVELRTVALVLGKLVLGILLVQHLSYIAVPADLCQNGGRRDRGAFPVAAYDEAVRRFNGVPAAVVPVPIDQGQLRPKGQSVDGPLHDQLLIYTKIYHLFLCYKPGLYYCFFMGKEIVVENPLFNALEIDTVPL